MGAKYRTGSSDSNPADECFRRNLEVLHAIKANKGSGAAKACFAVDGDCTSLRVSEVLLTGVHEVGNDFLGWS